jgi:hypothetical protein
MLGLSKSREAWFKRLYNGTNTAAMLMNCIALSIIKKK